MPTILSASKYIMCLAALMCVCLSASAQDTSKGDFASWLTTLRKEASDNGIANATLDSAFGHLQPIPRVIELDRQQPEFTQTFWNYLNQRITTQRIEMGRKMLKQHRALLTDVEKKYGVPPRFLVAFWGLETNFGSYLGGFPVIGSLATLAFDYRREAFFRAQLLDALRVLDEHSVTVADMQGSWAGAIGHLQFMPSTFLQYAVDATGDGKRDVWHSLPDVFASGGNYLSGIGWQRNEVWGREISLPKKFAWELADLSTKKSISEWTKLGVRRADGGALPKVDMQGAIVLPQGYEGPAFLVYDNFDVIMRWNRSINYAVTVGYLADRLINLPRIVHGRDAENLPLTREQAIVLQEKLTALGYDAGTPDGIPGAQTKSAMRDYQRANNLPMDGYPSMALVERITQK